MTYNQMDGKGSGGGGGIMDGQLDWGGNGGKCWECWVVAPCCDPYCCITWWCCGCFNQCKLFAWSVDQPCSIVNHCLPLTFCGICTACVMRHAIRKKAGVQAGGPMGGFVGDCLITYFCGACGFCQELRAAHTISGKESWDFFGNPKPEVMTDPLKFPPFMQ
eukprot:TRINITY_DN287_c0_g2_i1.p2 TRINITY_DN287_c0_g2~~TRINITY_DN287_c0_g2_i1.p2  ORF type:complete len:162 (+),score=48.15 TRINITY_DN287_c0_g2_i1:65-550(+)